MNYWARAPQGEVQRYVLAGEGTPQTWLAAQGMLTGMQLQYADAGAQGYRLLAWRDGELQLAFYAAPTLPVIDKAWVTQAFAVPPRSAAERHALLAGMPVQGGSQGRMVCSCYGVGEQTIRQAVADGCHTPAALGAALKCGTNCGSCLPELRQIIFTQQTEA